MKKFITNKYIVYALGTVLVFLIWTILSISFDANNMIFPSPIATIKEVGELLKKSYTYTCLSYTLKRMVYGFLLSLILAVIFSILASNFNVLYDLFKPLMTVIKAIPTVTITYLLIVIIAPKNAPTFVVSVISFPILYEAFTTGLKNIDREVIEASQIDGASFFIKLIKIKFPLAVSYFLVGIASSFALSFKIEIMAEVLTGYTRNGVGSSIAAFLNSASDLTSVFAYSFIIIIIVLLFSILSEIIKALFLKRK